MRSSSLKLAIEHGITSPKEYRDSLIHNWFLDPQEREHLLVFFQAKEYADELKDHIKNGAFILNKKEYQITWIHKPETVFSSKFALMSFRYCKLLNCGYVLIKELTENDTDPDDFNFVEYDKDNGQ